MENDTATRDSDTATRTSQRPLGSLVSGLTHDMSSLVREETELARTELSEKISQAVMGLVSFILAAVVMIAGLVILLQAAVDGLNHVLPPNLTPWLSALIVGLVFVGIGLILLMIGRSELKAKNLMPERTISSVRQDQRFAKEQVS